MSKLYIVLDEYEQRDGYFGYDLAYESHEEAKKAADALRKMNGDGNHDVFEISTGGTLQGHLYDYYSEEDIIKNLGKDFFKGEP